MPSRVKPGIELGQRNPWNPGQPPEAALGLGQVAFHKALCAGQRDPVELGRQEVVQVPVQVVRQMVGHPQGVHVGAMALHGEDAVVQCVRVVEIRGVVLSPQRSPGGRVDLFSRLLPIRKRVRLFEGGVEITKAAARHPYSGS